MAVNNFCEVCLKTGLASKMVPFQVNMEEALLICENTECVFPLGTARITSFVISRTANGMSGSKRTAKGHLALTRGLVNKSVDQKSEKVIHWQNIDALCWLDSALSLVVHNRTIKQLLSKLQTCENSLLKYLVDQYSKAQYLTEFDLSNARKVLEDVRSLVWTYLSPKMKCTIGVNDSPLFALQLLLRENAVTADNCLQKYACEFSCQECGHNDKTRHKKHIVTIPNTPENFNIAKCSFQKSCVKCTAQDQYCTIIYESVPDVIVLHFVEGLKSTGYLDYQFIHQNNTYCLTQFIQYTHNPDHFVCWTKEDNGSRWLELDDLKSPLCSWTSPPKISPSEVHIIVLQKTISMDSNISISQSQELESDSLNTLEEVNEVVQNHSNCKDTLQKDIKVITHMLDNTKCTANVELALKAQETAISSELHSKLTVDGSDNGQPEGNKRSPLKSCSPDAVENTKSASTPTVVDDRKMCSKTLFNYTSPQLSSSSSLFRVALKRLSSESKFQPLLPKKRTLSTQFQPYVPRRERPQVVKNTPATTPSDKNFGISENLLSPTGSDSGYSSPSSVSSCGSSTMKEETSDVADQLEKLLPDCLENSALLYSNNDCAVLKKISDEQDDLINKLLFSD